VDGGGNEVGREHFIRGAPGRVVNSHAKEGGRCGDWSGGRS
jgi:hypothetical protein